MFKSKRIKGDHLRLEKGLNINRGDKKSTDISFADRKRYLKLARHFSKIDLIRKVSKSKRIKGDHLRLEKGLNINRGDKKSTGISFADRKRYLKLAEASKKNGDRLNTASQHCIKEKQLTQVMGKG